MAYKACFQCEQLFEVDHHLGAAPMPCPECGHPLEDYVPEADELSALASAPPPDARTMALSPMDLAPLDDLHRHPDQGAILASAAIEGLSKSVQAQIHAERQALAPAPQMPGPQMPAPPIPEPQIPAPPIPEMTGPLTPEETPIGLPEPPAKKKKNPFEVGPLKMPGDEEDEVEIASGPRKTRVMEALTDLPAPDFDAPRATGRGGSTGQAPQALAPEPSFSPNPSSNPSSNLGELGAPQPIPDAPQVMGPDARSSTRVFDIVSDEAPEPPMAFTEPLQVDPASLAPKAQPPSPLDAPPTPRPQAQQRPKAPRPVKRRGPGLLLPLLIVLVIAGAGVGVWLAIGGERGTPTPETTPPEEAGPWSERFEARIADLEVVIPTVKQAEGIAERPFIIGGPEGLITSAGAVPGLPAASRKALAGALESNDDEAWLRNLDTAMKTASGGTALMALDQGLDAHALSLVGRSLYRAGFEQLALVVREGGQLAVVPFELRTLEDPIPASGAVVLYIGQRQATVTLQDGEGQTIAQSPERLAVGEGGTLDLAALSTQMRALRSARGEGDEDPWRSAVIRGGGDIALSHLAALMSHLRAEGDGGDFQTLAVTTR